MSCNKYPHMFQPMTVNGVTFKNRVFCSPITTNRVIENGYPTSEAIDVYETKARGGFATVTLTESFIDHEYSWRHEHGLNVWEKPMTTFHMESIMTLTEAIKAHGAVASIQLNHVGAMNHPDAIPGHKNPIGPSSLVREDGVQVEGMTIEQIDSTIETWAEAAWTCKSLGFEMVNLHGGHGWLLNQFISPRFNFRTDEYGGSMENRARFAVRLCDRIKEVCGKDFLIEYRLSGSERIEGGMTIEDGIEFAKIIQDHVDLLHITSGVYSDHVNTKAFSSMFDKHGCNLDLAEAIKKNVHIPVVAVGGFNAPEQIEEAIASGKCDFVAMGRQQFADPAFVNKTLEGREDEIAPCLRCSCFNPLASDPDVRPIPELWHCAVNPWGQRELRWRTAPTPNGKRKVLVVGGGASGMYAALTAAERGHAVVLCEKGDKLGGLLWFTEKDTHKESLLRFRDSLVARCKHNGVDIRLNTEVTREMIEEMKPDAVICAVGSHPFVPGIPGVENAKHALYAYDDLAALNGKKVVIIGGGAIGCESGYFFASECGAKVQILEMRDEMCKDSNMSQRMALLPRMDKAGMILSCSVSTKEIKPNGVVYTDKDGNEQFAEADLVLYCCGNRSNDAIVESLRGVVPHFVVTGDAKRARTVKQATYEGFCAAMDIL
jgi:2,4-dienoyl-CoA reductase-like NADH-dependent reductase (Old Yellow Enzyme family)/NADPH-dependent 2,4-dienoyl-CoA reductase/sulfur reductase-like enzyme